MKHYTEKKTNQEKIIRNCSNLLDKEIISPTRFNAICSCGSFLEFLADELLEHFKLYSGNFCKFSLCPMCNWRKSKKSALTIGIIMQHLHVQYQKEFILLTLTAPNVSGYDLSQELDNFAKSFHRLVNRTSVKAVIKGYVRKLEITYNQSRKDFHPHYHVLIAVNKSYFTDRSYIKHDQWLSLWRESMRNDAILSVDTRRIHIHSHIPSEMAKNAVKMGLYTGKDGYSIPNNSSNVFETLFLATKNRQILTFNGLFNQAHHLYKAGELDHLKEQDLIEYMYMLCYAWGYGEYVEEEKRELSPRELMEVNKKLINEIEDENE
jgi:plasmid rolling circle replication initiator protein Rep